MHYVNHGFGFQQEIRLGLANILETETLQVLELHVGIVKITISPYIHLPQPLSGK